MTKARKRLLWIGVGLIIPVGIAFLYTAFFLRLVTVPTGAMKNTILPGDHVALERFVTEIHRGDVVAFRYPRDPSTQFISRVVGLPGETIQIKSGVIFINGEELAEERSVVQRERTTDDKSALREISTTGAGSYRVYEYVKDDEDESAMLAMMVEQDATFGGRQPFLIPPAEYFMMGDNRDNSLDSRFWGTVKREAITGKAWMIYWSGGDEGWRPKRIFTRVK
jgi:signal peptidase I